MLIVERIRAARKKKKMTQQKLAELSGLSYAAIRKIESGKQQKSGNIVQIANALGVSPEYLTNEEVVNPIGGIELSLVDPKDQISLYVMGSVEAGSWREAVEIPIDDRESYPVKAHPNFVGFDQYLLRVVGSSMNMHYPDGVLVHCVKLAFAPRDLELRDGDHVVVQRERAGFYESTVKELINGKLWPRSTDPAHQNPITLNNGDNDEVEITALVIGAYNPRPNLLDR